MTPVSIALNRFGLGARPGDAVPADPKRWLLDQLHGFNPRPPALAAAPTSAAVATRLAAFYDGNDALRRQYGPRKQVRAQLAAMTAGTPAQAMPMAAMPVPGPGGGMAAAVDDPYHDARQAAGRDMRDSYATAVAARADAALATDTPFAERLVHFWANHFAVSADKLELVGLAGTLEAEAIRPHLTGRFADMLLAVEQHPAMLLYLDQAVSVGPDSALGQRVAARGVRKVGLNENLAREIMELHTLGVRTGYTQADVTEFARALTGWTVAGIGRRGQGGITGQPGAFAFAPVLHEPGDRTIVGRRYPAGGEEQGRAVLTDLARSDATATHLATKLARHFAGDVAPPAMVARLKTAYLRTDGDLPTVYRAVVASPEAWVAAPVKFRNPWEWAVACDRALGVQQVQPGAIVGLMNQLGQPVWRPGQPVGYDDVAGSWAAPDAVMRRVEAAERIAARAPAVDARALATRLFPGAVSPATEQAIARAESPAQALALLLVAPEMMRR